MGKHLKFFVWTAIFMLVLSFSVGSFATAGEEDNKADTETVTETFTFETTENDSGYTLADTDLSDIFTVDAVAGGTADISDDGNAKLAMFSQVYLPMEQAYDMLQRSYTFQIDFGSTGAPESAIYLRAIDPQTYTKMNPIQSVAQTFNFYEWDWYAETGGSGTSETGGSGIKVYQRKNKIFVDLKLYVEDGLNIRGKAIDFDFPEGFKQDDLNTFM